MSILDKIFKKKKIGAIDIEDIIPSEDTTAFIVSMGTDFDCEHSDGLGEDEE